MVTNGTRQRVAIIGAGISGITAAYLLSLKHDVVLFEKATSIGGHTNTILIKDGPDAGTSVDTGFIVCNPVNYKNFYQFMDLLEVPRRDAEMTFGFYAADTGLQYKGPDLIDFLSAPQNLLNRSFCRMILDQRRFNRIALADLRDGKINNESLGEYTKRLKVSPFFITHYLIPLAASIWSSPDANILEFPAVTFLTFFRNHGMLELHKRPQWQTIIGGSHSYLRSFERVFSGTIRTNCEVISVSRDSGVDQPSVTLVFNSEGENAADTSGGTIEKFDSVIFGCHADEALGLLADPTPEETKLLGSWRYHKNRAVLHTDALLMPPKKRLWASWNYTLQKSNPSGGCESGLLVENSNSITNPVAITYSMNRLQGLRTTEEYFVTLNPSTEPQPKRKIYETNYSHPCYTASSVESQEKIQQIQGINSTYFCGAHLGYGFHEDGVVSAMKVAKHFGCGEFIKNRNL